MLQCRTLPGTTRTYPLHGKTSGVRLSLRSLPWPPALGTAGEGGPRAQGELVSAAGSQGPSVRVPAASLPSHVSGQADFCSRADSGSLHCQMGAVGLTSQICYKGLIMGGNHRLS